MGLSRGPSGGGPISWASRAGAYGGPRGRGARRSARVVGQAAAESGIMLFISEGDDAVGGVGEQNPRGRRLHCSSFGFAIFFAQIPQTSIFKHNTHGGNVSISHDLMRFGSIQK